MDIIPFMAVLALLMISIIVITIQYGRNVIITRRLYDKNRQTLKEREATADILRISSVAIRSEEANENVFLSYFVEYVTRALQGSGAAAFVVSDKGQFEGCAVAGTFPPIKEVTPQVEQKLLASHRNHAKFLEGQVPNFSLTQLREATKENNFCFYRDGALPEGWFPKRFGEIAKRVLIAPILRHKRVEACVIVVSGDEFDEHALNKDDGWYLVRLNELASLSLDGIRMFRERQKYEESLQNAREEGMLQVSTGIIHNIGNAVTVAKLNVHELQTKYAEVEDRPEKLILNMILPKLEEENAKGALQAFLSSPAGAQYLSMTRELVGHIDKSERDNRDLLNSLNNKLHHISEIIELQQRFVGELGTENLTTLSAPLESAIKIYEETFNKSGIKIEADIQRRTHDVLVDISMMTQVFINIIKNAGEAMAADPDKGKDHRLNISLREDGGEDNIQNIVVRITDNGPGIPETIVAKIFNFGFSTKNVDKNGHGFGLHNCQKTIEKYGGKIAVETELGKGSTFVVTMPARQGAVT